MRWRQIAECLTARSTKSEKRVFLAAARENHPFLLGLHSCFQTETRIYLCMEYVRCGSSGSATALIDPAAAT